MAHLVDFAIRHAQDEQLKRLTIEPLANRFDVRIGRYSRLDPTSALMIGREFRHFLAAAFVPFSLSCFGFLLFLSFF